MKDLLNKILPKRALSPVVVTDGTAQVTQIIDRQGYDSVAFVIATGTLADADAVWGVTLKHGDAADMSDEVDVPANELSGTLAGAGFAFGDDNECRTLGYVGVKRYLRLTIDDTTANTGNAPMCVVALLGDPQQGPTGQPS